MSLSVESVERGFGEFLEVGDSAGGIWLLNTNFNFTRILILTIPHLSRNLQILQSTRRIKKREMKVIDIIDRRDT